MDFEFDKEIDSLMRQMAKGEIVTKNLPKHLDADEISAFAENALPQKSRLNAMEHLADCTRCRKILADVVLLNAEESSEIIHAAQEPKTIVAVPKTPWYRQLFAFPNLAYAMGFLTLAFSGIVGYVILQGVNQETNSSVAQSDKVFERPNAKGASSDGDYSVADSSANSNSSAATNTAANASRSANSANTAANAPIIYATPIPSSNSTSATPASPTMAENTGGESAAPAKSAPRESELSDVAKKEEKSDNNKDKRVSTDGVEDRGTVSRSNEVMPNMTQQSQSRSNNIMTPDSNNAQRSINNLPAPPAPGLTGGVRENDGDDALRTRSAKKSAPKVSAENKPVDSIQVNGKTFQNKNGVWTDSAYKGGSTKNVKRNSDDYKKLDASLRSYSDNLSGTVIVVWNGKAYKIQ